MAMSTYLQFMDQIPHRENMDLFPKDASSSFVHNQGDQPVTSVVVNNQTSRDYSGKSKRPRLSEVQRREKKRQTDILYRRLKRIQKKRYADLAEEIKGLKMINHQSIDAINRLKEAIERLQPNLQLRDQNLEGLDLIQDCGAVDCVHSQADQPVTTGVMNNQTSHEDSGKSKRRRHSDIQRSEKKNHAMMSRQQREHRKGEQVQCNEDCGAVDCVHSQADRAVTTEVMNNQTSREDSGKSKRRRCSDIQRPEKKNHAKISCQQGEHRKGEQVEYAALMKENNYLKIKIRHLTNKINELKESSKQLQSCLQFPDQNLERLMSPLIQDQCNNNCGAFDWSDFEMNPDIEDLQKVSVNEGVANNVEDKENSLAGTCYDSSNITKLLLKIDADDKSRITFSDFVGLLDGDYIVIGSYSFPLSLHPTHKRINSVYGDISATCKMTAGVVRTTYILFCATIKEMDDLLLEEVTEKKLLKWRDAIKDALRVGFRVEFAMEHLKKIAHAFVGLGLFQELNSKTIRSSKLETDFGGVYAKLFEQFKPYKDSVELFSCKSVSTGLFP